MAQVVPAEDDEGEGTELLKRVARSFVQSRKK
jgi:hypothetical protein